LPPEKIFTISLQCWRVPLCKHDLSSIKQFQSMFFVIAKTITRYQMIMIQSYGRARAGKIVILPTFFWFTTFKCSRSYRCCNVRIRVTILQEQCYFYSFAEMGRALDSQNPPLCIYAPGNPLDISKESGNFVKIRNFISKTH